MDQMSLNDTRTEFLVFLWFPERRELRWGVFSEGHGAGGEGEEAPSPAGHEHST